MAKCYEVFADLGGGIISLFLWSLENVIALLYN